MKYYLLLLITSALWGGNFVAGKFLVGHASPLALTSMRWLLAILCLIPIVLWKERTLRLKKEAFASLLAMGLTGVIFFNVLMFQALQYTSADNVGLLSTLNPIAIAVVSYFFYHETLAKRQWLAMFISLLGVMIVMTHGHIETLLRLHFNIGDLFMLAAVLVWGLYSAFAKKAMKWHSPLEATFWSGVFGTIGMLPFTLSSFSIKTIDASFAFALLYTSLGATVLAMIFWNIGVQKIGGTKSGIFLNFNPLFTALFAYVWLGEQMNGAQLIGSIITISGVVLFAKK
ncbi:DMT family transporter [Thermolongibacillus altinsuensis]|jgi:drug/metabolite transporter (DMT)-like permease